MNQLIWYPKCSTCKNAKQAIESCGLKFELRDVKEEKLDLNELKDLIQKSGLPVRKFLFRAYKSYFGYSPTDTEQKK